MPRMTQQERLIAGLERLGYARVTNTRGSKFIEFRLAPGSHRVLVGKSGAFRYTTSTIAKSVPFSARTKTLVMGASV